MSHAVDYSKHICCMARLGSTQPKTTSVIQLYETSYPSQAPDSCAGYRASQSYLLCYGVLISDDIIEALQTLYIVPSCLPRNSQSAVKEIRCYAS